MSLLSPRPNIKLAKLWYKYMDQDSTKSEDNLNKTLIVPEKTEPLPESKDYESYAPYNFSWLVENKIAAMACPQSVANLNYLVDAGINHLVTLSPERWPPIMECDKKLKWTEIPIKEYGAPTLKQILKFIAICERAEIRGEVVGVHCRQGRGRTGTMLACYLVYFKNMAPERAVLTIRVQRPGSCETYEQEKIVCHYHDCLRGTITKPDYRMVDDKLYFECSMKHMYGDETKSDEEQELDQKETVTNDEKLKTTKIKNTKSKAMVINHKIYF